MAAGFPPPGRSFSRDPDNIGPADPALRLRSTRSRDQRVKRGESIFTGFRRLEG
jgi:hypothetical protein